MKELNDLYTDKDRPISIKLNLRYHLSFFEVWVAVDSPTTEPVPQHQLVLANKMKKKKSYLCTLNYWVDSTLKIEQVSLSEYGFRDGE